jgi:thymidine phosphorylase
VLAILEKQKIRALELEQAAISLAGAALELSGKAKRGYGKKLARQCLQDGSALAAWQKISAAQKKKNTEEIVKSARLSCQVKAAKAGRVREFYLSTIADTAKTLGAPQEVGSGIVFKVKLAEKVKAGQVLFTLFAARPSNLNLAVRAAKQLKLLKIN